MKRTDKRTNPGRLDDLAPDTLSDKELERVKGGKTPTPGGPVPLPYPNTGITGDVPPSKSDTTLRR